MPKHSTKLYKSKSGFTLIELLVVILVISALSGVLLSVINRGGLRAKARDATRKTDLNQTQIALETYFADYREYPQSASSNWEEIDGGSGIEAALETSYITEVPRDPSGVVASDDDPCGNDDAPRYNYRSDGTYYVLTAVMEQATSNDDAPCDGAGVPTQMCGTPAANCYYVRNP